MDEKGLLSGLAVSPHTWTSKMAKILDPLPVLSILGYWAIVLCSFGGSFRPLKEEQTNRNYPGLQLEPM